jgi:hypothetical protein
MKKAMEYWEIDEISTEFEAGKRMSVPRIGSVIFNELILPMKQRYLLYAVW